MMTLDHLAARRTLQPSQPLVDNNSCSIGLLRKVRNALTLIPYHQTVKLPCELQVAVAQPAKAGAESNIPGFYTRFGQMFHLVGFSKVNKSENNVGLGLDIISLCLLSDIKTRHISYRGEIVAVPQFNFHFATRGNSPLYEEIVYRHVNKQCV